jgi:hypothetical protein
MLAHHGRSVATFGDLGRRTVCIIKKDHLNAGSFKNKRLVDWPDSFKYFLDKTKD